MPMTRAMHSRSSTRADGPASAGLHLGIAAALLIVSAGSALAGGISVEKPWMRLIIKSRPAAGYFTLHNGTNKAVELTGASSNACGMLMLHQSKEQNGMDTMMHVKNVTVPAGGEVTFAPGGYHLMCMHPQSSMVVGKSVPVKLEFANGQSVTTQFPVTGPGGKK